MKHILSKTLLLMALAIVLGCTDKLELEQGSANFDEGELTECKLSVEVADFDVSSASRAADPDENANKSASEQEKRIDNIWVFQYDASEKILIKPRYYTTESKDGDNWLVLLKEKADEVSTIYVVANTNSSTWASSLDDFSTLASLKAQTLPNPDPIEITDESTATFTIPMEGSVETVTDLPRSITVPVERMFAKLVISAKMLKEEMDLTAIEVNNIPSTCSVESFSCDDADATKEQEAAAYPTTTTWITRSLATTEITGTEDESQDNLKIYDGTYILYIPENIQGEAADANKLKATNIPANALTVNYHLDVSITDDDGGTSEISDCSTSVFPGSNKDTNFNVKRNHIYNITGTFPTTRYFVPVPSANCFIVKPGKSMVFWPYYRTETGGGYDIRTYLDPTVGDLTISSVKIIWQEEGVIGDNSNGKLVTMSTLTKENVPNGTDEYEYLKNNFKIKVQTAKEGNALIGAYNSGGDIIWSWHIWVTDNDPGNVGNAIRYTTYDWDADGIKCNENDPSSAARVSGYQVMPCNLGAKKFTPDGDPTDTYGPLYQWGRKDPFPSMKGTGKTVGFADYNSLSSAETKGTSFNNVTSQSTTGSNIQVYDNSNKKITLKGTGYTDEKAYDEVGNLLDDKYKLFQTVYYTTAGESTDAALKYSIQHPTTFISPANKLFNGNTKFYNNNDYNLRINYDNNGDWLVGHDDKLWGGLEPDLSQKHRHVVNSYTYNWGKALSDDLAAWMWDNYGDEKTIFDPSPAGWRVPPQDFWLGLTSTGESIHQRAFADADFDVFLEHVNSTDKAEDIDSNNGYYLYLTAWKTGMSSFFPCPGSRLGSGQPLHLNFCGNYHCASSAPMVSNGAISQTGRVNCFHVHAQCNKGTPTKSCQLNPFEYQRLFIYKSVAGPIRCVRDKK